MEPYGEKIVSLKEEKLELVYVADAMCSWCWGFAPVVSQLRHEYADRLAFRLVMGGLRPGPAAQLVDERVKADLKHHWEAVHARSGQPFDHTFFQREGFIYDTEPASKSVVAVRRLAPEKEFSFFHALQEAFYARNVDITHADKLADLAKEAGVDDARFSELLASEEVLKATRQDYAYARALGVSGFPSLVLVKGGLGLTVTYGYMALHEARTALEDGLRRME